MIRHRILVLELELALVLHPWHTAWDLAFHTLPLAIVDPDFAKEQMRLMLKGGVLPTTQLTFLLPTSRNWSGKACVMKQLKGFS